MVRVHKFLKPSFHYPSCRPELMGDRFTLPVNTVRVDGHAFPLAELTGRVDMHYPLSFFQLTRV